MLRQRLPVAQATGSLRVQEPQGEGRGGEGKKGTPNTAFSVLWVNVSLGKCYHFLHVPWNETFGKHWSRQFISMEGRGWVCGQHSFLGQEANLSFCNTLWHAFSTWLFCVTTGADEPWDPVLLVLIGLILFTALVFLGITLSSHCLFFPANTENKGYLTIKYRMIFFREETKCSFIIILP